MFFGDLPRTKINPTWVFFRIFFRREQPWASDGSRHLRKLILSVFHVAVEKASSGNQNLGNPKLRKWKFGDLIFGFTKQNSIQKLEWQKMMGSQTSQSCFKWGNHSLVSQCVVWTESFHQRVPGPICCGAVLDILNEAVLPPANCRADGTTFAYLLRYRNWPPFS